MKGFAADILAPSAGKTDNNGLSEKEIAYNVGHAWAGVTQVQYKDSGIKNGS